MRLSPPSGGTVPVRGWILYDDTCGFCRRLAPRLPRRLRGQGIATAPLQSPWVAARLGEAHEDIAKDIRLLIADDAAGATVIRGADVYRYALRVMTWTYPLYVLSLVVPLRQAFDLCYRLIAHNRHRLSRMCALPAGEARPGSGDQSENANDRSPLSSSRSAFLRQSPPP